MATKPSKILFVVTGFGPFSGCDANPTTVLSNNIIEYLEKRESTSTETRDQDAGEVKLTMASATVICNSAEAVRSELDALHQKFHAATDENNESELVVVMIHTGVYLDRKSFQLEKFAYNKASFPIPDAAGYHPREERIIDSLPLGEALETQLDIDDVYKGLVEKEPRVVVSTDPGDFVCNYIYCYSMNKFQSHRSAATNPQDPRFLSLFFHVPPFSEIPEDQQLRALALLMETIHKQLISRS